MTTTSPAGTFRHRVDLERRSTGSGSRGQRSGAWQTVREIAAEVLELAGRQLENARKISSSATHQVRLRQPSDATLTTDDYRFNYGGRLLTIAEIAPVDGDQYNRELIAVCSEKKT